MSKYLIIGDSCLDIYRSGDVHRLSPELPVPVLSFSSEEIRGGMAENVQNNVISLSQEPKRNIYLYTSDCLSKKIRYVDKGSNYQLLRVDEECSKGSKFERKEFDRILSEFKPDTILISCYNKGFLTDSDIEYIGQVATELGIKTFCDTKKLLSEFTLDLDYVKINNKEFAAHIKAGIMSPHKYCRNLIVTNGSSDTTLYTDQAIIDFPVKNVEVFSVIGAGDVALSALAVRYTESKDIFEAIRFANDAASYKVKKSGTYAVKRDELNAFRAYA